MLDNNINILQTNKIEPTEKQEGNQQVDNQQTKQANKQHGNQQAEQKINMVMTSKQNKQINHKQDDKLRELTH